MLTLEQAREIIAALEMAQMLLPRGEHIQPNTPIARIADAADAVVMMFEPDQRGGLIHEFTWGLDEQD